jgi:hypothetical protein
MNSTNVVVRNVVGAAVVEAAALVTAASLLTIELAIDTSAFKTLLYHIAAPPGSAVIIE